MNGTARRLAAKAGDFIINDLSPTRGGNDGALALGKRKQRFGIAHPTSHCGAISYTAS